MDDKLTIFIAVTASAVVLQMLILAGMYFALRKLSARLQTVTDDVQSRLIPVLENTKMLQVEATKLLESSRPKVELILNNATHISSTTSEFVDRARLQAIRIEQIVTATLDRVEQTSSKVQQTVLSPVKQVNGILQGIGVALGTLFEKPRRNRSGPAQDEMFI